MEQDDRPSEASVWVQVKGKLNAITIDQCSKTGVVFQDLVASCELVNSSSLQVQVTGLVPTVAIDKCDGVQVQKHLPPLPLPLPTSL